MPIAITESHDGKIIKVKLSGKLNAEDYDHFVPEVERQMEKHGKVSILVEMHDFHGWTAGALWADSKFGLKHFGDIDKLALVGDSKWEEGMAKFCAPFTKAEIKYFYSENAAEAESWIAA